MDSPEAIEPLAERIPLGVGCFHLVPLQPGDDRTPAGFRENLRNALGAITNVDNIEVTGFETMRAGDMFLHKIKELPPFEDAHSFDITDGPGLFPHFVSSRVTFDLYLPSRVQREVFTWGDEVGVERFRINLVYGNEFPVAFIEAAEPMSNANPSEFVPVVRELLKRELAQRDLFSFQALGPSPFPAEFFFDFHVAPGDSGLSVERDESNGRVSFSFLFVANSDSDSDSDSEFASAKGWMLKDLANKIGFYYRLCQERNMAADEWRDANISFEEAQERFMVGPRWKRWLGGFAGRNMLGHAFFAVTRLELASLEVNGRVKRWREESGTEWLEPFCAELVAEISEFPTEKMVRMIEWLEARGKAVSANTVVFIAAIAGAALGAGLVSLL